ncbi:MAG: DUF4276 family protein [Bacteroidales bacterium]
MNSIPLKLVFEDLLSEFVMKKLVEKTGRYLITNSYPGGGYGYIKKNIDRFSEASRAVPFFILTDLDQAICANVLKREWLKREPHPNLIFRIAVREVEAWLLADIEGFSKFSGRNLTSIIPKNTELIQNPKEFLIQLIRKSRFRTIREDIIPKDAFANIGPNYNQQLCIYVNNFWDLDNAVKHSDSLRRAVIQLKTFNMT